MLYFEVVASTRSFLAIPHLCKVVNIIFIRRFDAHLRGIELCGREVVDGRLPPWLVAIQSEAFVSSGLVAELQRNIRLHEYLGWIRAALRRIL